MTKAEQPLSKRDQRANNEKCPKGEECLFLRMPVFSPSQCYLPVKKGHLFLGSTLLKAVSAQWTDDGLYSSCAEADGHQCYVKQPGLFLFWYVVNRMVSAYVETLQGETATDNKADPIDKKKKKKE